MDGHTLIGLTGAGAPLAFLHATIRTLIRYPSGDVWHMPYERSRPLMCADARKLHDRGTGVTRTWTLHEMALRPVRLCDDPGCHSRDAYVGADQHLSTAWVALDMFDTGRRDSDWTSSRQALRWIADSLTQLRRLAYAAQKSGNVAAAAVLDDVHDWLAGQYTQRSAAAAEDRKMLMRQAYRAATAPELTFTVPGPGGLDPPGLGLPDLNLAGAGLGKLEMLAAFTGWQAATVLLYAPAAILSCALGKIEESRRVWHGRATRKLPDVDETVLAAVLADWDAAADARTDQTLSCAVLGREFGERPSGDTWRGWLALSVQAFPSVRHDSVVACHIPAVLARRLRQAYTQQRPQSSRDGSHPAELAVIDGVDVGRFTAIAEAATVLWESEQPELEIGCPATAWQVAAAATS